MVFFSSRRRHTRYWRDWSSDVCSSDLRLDRQVDVIVRDEVTEPFGDAAQLESQRGPPRGGTRWAPPARGARQIWRASGRGRGEISVVGVSIKKKTIVDRGSMLALPKLS